MAKPYLAPLLAGVGLGATLYATFMLTGHGLGAYGFFRDLAAELANRVDAFWATENTYFSNFIYEHGPGSMWIAWEIGGLALGALLGSLLARRFKVQVERGAGVSVPARLTYAVLGGVCTGLGAALARGCTSGLGLSGAALLSTGALVFLAAFFVAGIVAAFWARALWK